MLFRAREVCTLQLAQPEYQKKEKDGDLSPALNPRGVDLRLRWSYGTDQDTRLMWKF